MNGQAFTTVNVLAAAGDRDVTMNVAIVRFIFFRQESAATVQQIQESRVGTKLVEERPRSMADYQSCPKID